MKSLIDAASGKEFQLSTSDIVDNALKSFDPKLKRNLIGLFKDGTVGLKKFMDDISGQKTSAAEMRSFLSKALNKDKDLLANQNEIGLTDAKLDDILLLMNGQGVLVNMGNGIYCIHCDYQPGSPTDKAVADAAAKRGRTYVSVPGYGLLDPSDTDYLTDYTDYLESASPEELANFYNTVSSFLIESDTSGLKNLSSDGKRAAAYLMGIYMAEAIRFLGTGSKSHSWQIDIITATDISLFVAASGYIYMNGKFQSGGKPSMYFAKGASGSGIGDTRKYRIPLTQAVSSVVFQMNPKLISDLEDIIGEQPQHDVIQGMARFFNDAKNAAKIAQKGPELIQARAAFLGFIHSKENAAKIVAAIKADPKLLNAPKSGGPVGGSRKGTSRRRAA
jgi:hypothetical protein